MQCSGKTRLARHRTERPAHRTEQEILVFILFLTCRFGFNQRVLSELWLDHKRSYRTEYPLHSSSTGSFGPGGHTASLRSCLNSNNALVSGNIGLIRADTINSCNTEERGRFAVQYKNQMDRQSISIPKHVVFLKLSPVLLHSKWNPLHTLAGILPIEMDH